MPADPAKARSLLESVADTEPVAMRKLGFMYDRGIGVPKDYVMARQWYEKAAAGGDASEMGSPSSHACQRLQARSLVRAPWSALDTRMPFGRPDRGVGSRSPPWRSVRRRDP